MGRMMPVAEPARGWREPEVPSPVAPPIESILSEVNGKSYALMSDTADLGGFRQIFPQYRGRLHLAAVDGDSLRDRSIADIAGWVDAMHRYGYQLDEKTGVVPDPRYIVFREGINPAEIGTLIEAGATGVDTSRFRNQGMDCRKWIVRDLSAKGIVPLPPEHAVVVEPVARLLRWSELKPGQECQGMVTKVVPFGAFVDFGAEQDGLVHISKMSDRFIRDTSEFVAAGDVVRVWILGVDDERKRVSLTMLPPNAERMQAPELESGAAGTPRGPRRPGRRSKEVEAAPVEEVEAELPAAAEAVHY